MNLRRSTSAVIILAALLLVALLAVFAAVQTSEAAQRSGITLPSAQTQQDAAQPSGSHIEFAEITPQNVQTVLRKTLSRPDAYHQTLQTTLESGGHKRTQTIELWRNGSLLRADITDSTVRHLLTDGQTLYVWYDNEQSPAVLTPDDASTDALLGLPDYESLVRLPKSSIQQAMLTTLPEYSDVTCILLTCAQDGTTQHYWVSLDSGLLCRYVMEQDEATLYTAEQTALELLVGDDEALRAPFCLPDGSQPFSTEAKTQQPST